MKKITLLLLVFALCKVSAQKKTEEIVSESLKETRLITVKLPASYERDKEKKYPLLIVLDGDYL